MLTIMGIKARELNVNLTGTKVDITKVMASDPRRISGVRVLFEFPVDLQTDDKQRTILERAALHCPVAKSLHPDIVQDVVFNWPV